jgi:DNA-binding Xre family transcriptional regulator
MLKNEPKHLNYVEIVRLSSCKNMTIMELAKKAGVHHSIISPKYTKNFACTQKIADKIANALGCTRAEILCTPKRQDENIVQHSEYNKFTFTLDFDKLNAMLKTRHITKQKLAKQADIHRCVLYPSYSRMHNPRFASLSRIASALDCKLEEICVENEV